MRQQVCKNKSWKKRVAAAGMAICMACTMPFSVQAENVTEEYNVQEDYSTESAAENVSDEKSEFQSYDIETAQTVNQEDSAVQEPSKEEVQLSLQLVAVEKTRYPCLTPFYLAPFGKFLRQKLKHVIAVVTKIWYSTNICSMYIKVTKK